MKYQNNKRFFFCLFILHFGWILSSEVVNIEEPTQREGRQVLRIPANECQLSYADFPRAHCDGAASCILYRGGIAGLCHSGIGYCCVVVGSCGRSFPVKAAYFQNNWFPSATQETRHCESTIERYHPDASQVKLDFLTFSLDQPNSDGVCETESLTIEGADPSFPLHSLCGDLTGQHIYVKLDPDGDGKLKLNVKLEGTSGDTSKFNILATQYSETDGAPSGCLQYYSKSNGLISSFNAGKQHLASQDYEACIKKPSSSCNVTWNSQALDVSPPVSTSDECEHNSYDQVILGDTPYCGGQVIQDEITDVHRLAVSFDEDESVEPSDLGRRGFIIEYNRSCP